ncbi:hypothetical protein KPH14_003500 [Odynerus spinipes]|uniref:protein-tyrosine-phosphatase n=1 Tax=Odynerus spinipes TaxID=1348599 RepID=A0AAD9VKR2_9HYME|nr:hypothetical protein KPH14_003500 [Odynerus spinipes]
MDGPSSLYNHPDIHSIAEYIKNKLYFATLKNDRQNTKKIENVHFFNIDNELVYNNFYNDFGPLNLACLYRYCCKVNKKLNNPANKHKILVHCTSKNDRKRANAAYLIASYAVLYLNKNPKEAYKPLILGKELSLRLFQDASLGPSIYNIHLLDCLNALYKAALYGFFNFEDFDLLEYEKYEQIQNGDLNWIVPQKFLAFVSPTIEKGTSYHPPECYINYFLKNDVGAVVRLNKKTYDSNSFTKAGITHYDMFMPDGSIPPKRILNKFLHLAETTSGAIAVHCKAGLGRTGSLIAAYLIKHYKMSAREAIAWTRICRSGSVIGHQQAWLENMEHSLWNEGQEYRLKYRGDSDMVLHHRQGIYSIANKLENEERDLPETDHPNCDHRKKYLGPNDYGGLPTDKLDKSKLSRILGKLRNVSGTTDTNTAPRDSMTRKRDPTKHRRRKINPIALTQGDKLNEIKANRNKAAITSAMENKRAFAVTDDM